VPPILWSSEPGWGSGKRHWENLMQSRAHWLAVRMSESGIY